MSKFYHPSYIGFDRVFSLMNDLNAPISANYPPYNLVKTDENKYLIELAIAGFAKEQLKISIQENILTIAGDNSSEEEGYVIHRGIAARAFTRKFTLADTVEIRDIVLKDGMLRIYLENVIPEAKKPRTLEIKTDNPKLLVENK